MIKPLSRFFFFRRFLFGNCLKKSLFFFLRKTDKPPPPALFSFWFFFVFFFTNVSKKFQNFSFHHQNRLSLFISNQPLPPTIFALTDFFSQTTRPRCRYTKPRQRSSKGGPVGCPKPDVEPFRGESILEDGQQGSEDPNRDGSKGPTSGT